MSRTPSWKDDQPTRLDKKKLRDEKTILADLAKQLAESLKRWEEWKNAGSK